MKRALYVWSNISYFDQFDFLSITDHLLLMFRLSIYLLTVSFLSYLYTVFIFTIFLYTFLLSECCHLLFLYFSFFLSFFASR